MIKIQLKNTFSPSFSSSYQIPAGMQMPMSADAVVLHRPLQAKVCTAVPEQRSSL